MKLQEKIFKKLFEEAEIAKFSPEKVMAYHNSLKHYRDIRNVIETARQDGEKMGRIEESQEILVKQMSLKFKLTENDIKYKTVKEHLFLISQKYLFSIISELDLNRLSAIIKEYISEYNFIFEIEKIQSILNDLLKKNTYKLGDLIKIFHHFWQDLSINTDLKSPKILNNEI